MHTICKSTLLIKNHQHACVQNMVYIRKFPDTFSWITGLLTTIVHINTCWWNGSLKKNRIIWFIDTFSKIIFGTVKAATCDWIRKVVFHEVWQIICRCNPTFLRVTMAETYIELFSLTMDGNWIIFSWTLGIFVNPQHFTMDEQGPNRYYF